MENDLKKLGLTKTEAQIYLSLLSFGRATPTRIARETNVKRPTVYAALESLLREGIVWEDKSSKTKTFYAVPSDLKNIIIRQKSELEAKDLLAKSILTDLESISQSKEFSSPRIRHVRQEDLSSFLYAQTKAWNDSLMSTPDKSWWGYNSLDLTQHKVYQEWIDWYWKNSDPSIRLHLFSPSHAGEEVLQKNHGQRRNITYWDQEAPASLWVCGDYITFMATEKKPHYLIEIKDSLIASSLRTTYQALWKIYNAANAN